MNAQTNQTSTLAIVSLVAGILGWTFLPFLGSVGAIITGHMARKEIRQSNAALGGDTMAIIGLVLGWLSVAMWVIGLAIVFLFLGGLAWLGIANS